MNILQKLNSPVLYLICGGIILFVAIICVIFMIRAYKAGKAIGMDVSKMKRTIIASATFAVLPSVGILLGVIALSGSLGTPLPWLRLSVIGALHYETQVAEAAAEKVGIGLSASQMTPTAFVTIALLMGICIMWGMILSIFTCKKYCDKLNGKPSKKKAADPEAKPKKKKLDLSGFGDLAMTALFVGLVSAYIGSYIGTFASGSGLLKFTGDWIPLAVAVVGAAAMALFIFIRDKFKAEWVDGFSIAGSMLIAMASAVLFANI